MVIHARGGQPEIVIFVGLPASGKTTFYHRHFAESHQLVSKDIMPRSASKDKRQREEIEAALSAGLSVVVDNTNPTVAAREPLVALGRRFGARVVAIEFLATTRESIVLNRHRLGAARVPQVAIFTAAKKYQRPTMEEGFDEIRTVRPVEEALKALPPPDRAEE